MTSRHEMNDCKLNRDDLDASARGRGHVMEWRLAPNARRKGHAYYWIGDCVNCAANMIVHSGGSSCQGVRDARRVVCSGPGTAVLTEIEAARMLELVAEAVTAFGNQVADNARRATGESN